MKYAKLSKLWDSLNSSFWFVLSLMAMTFADLQDAAFKQIRQYGRSSVAVTMRLLEAIATIAPFTHQSSDRIELAPKLRAIAFVSHHVMQMSQQGYAQPEDWSKPLPTVNPNEVMRILTKHIMRLNT